MRGIALLAALCIVLALLTAGVFSLQHASHVCEGLHCVVCSHIAQASGLLRRLAICAGFLICSLLLCKSVLLLQGIRLSHLLLSCHIVDMKIRMNN